MAKEDNLEHIICGQIQGKISGGSSPMRLVDGIGNRQPLIVTQGTGQVRIEENCP